MRPLRCACYGVCSFCRDGNYLTTACTASWHKRVGRLFAKGVSRCRLVRRCGVALFVCLFLQNRRMRLSIVVACASRRRRSSGSFAPFCPSRDFAVRCHRGHAIQRDSQKPRLLDLSRPADGDDPERYESNVYPLCVMRCEIWRPKSQLRRL
jgi:hypothetical protein